MKFLNGPKPGITLMISIIKRKSMRIVKMMMMMMRIKSRRMKFMKAFKMMNLLLKNLHRKIKKK
jgi:hypothetical protein